VKPNDVFTLSTSCAKLMLKDYGSASVDLNSTDEMKLNDVFTLNTHGDVKQMLKDNEGASVDLNKADEVKPYDVFNFE